MEAWHRVEPFLTKRNFFAKMYTIGTSWTAFWHAKEEPITEEQIERDFAQIRNARGAYYCGHLQTIFWSHDEDMEKMIALIERACDHRFACHGHWNSQELVFVIAMLYMRCIRGHVIQTNGHNGKNGRISGEKVWHERIEQAFTNFAILKEMCPANAEHKYLLLTAEKLRMEEKDMQALEYYEKARVSALYIQTW